MGFAESYNVLSSSSLVSWSSASSTKEAKPTIQQAKDQTQQQSIVSLDCKSFLLSGLRSLLGRRQSSSNSSNGSSKGGSDYKRPSKCKRLFRRCKARTRKLQSSCYDSYYAEPKLHYYKTDSYERNFDRGREYWHDLPFLDISPFCSPPSSPSTSPSQCRPLSWSQQPQQQQEFVSKRRNHSTSTPI